MASSAVRSKVVVLLLLIYCSLLIQMFCLSFVFGPCFVVHYLSVSLLHGAVGWSGVCDCGSSWPYSLTFCYFQISYVNF